SCEGESGSARNSSRPRETFTAPATLPLFSTSCASRTSTIRVLPCATMSRACAGVIRGTAALAASINSFKFVVMCAPPTPQLYLGGGRTAEYGLSMHWIYKYHCHLIECPL